MSHDFKKHKKTIVWDGADRPPGLVRHTPRKTMMNRRSHGMLLRDDAIAIADSIVEFEGM
jgi:hypothetical protein